ncbi:two component transcriptional regulator, LytTR family [Filimonas lacunae]|uniref:Two component transcriptional regulator, LytTR family n=1 Tax=Filimonas lacunae TaxID=477680 RepID=A0A173MHF0_9BACT|nr:LytTR family DNA-binding domain-containing protein [Filimonas lacunae]BAV07025.1 two-component system response regulator [Filimonas lacunae]SIS96141.1 two component transcriptional regulator, LytTR family [Filimonas lacunae]
MTHCIVVDDEPLARQLIVSYIDQLPNLHCLGSYANALDALAALNSHPVEVLFLDIDMPGISGMSFIRSIKHIPKVVFITAHAEFAVEAFELEAADYLVKPVSFDRFLKSVQKITQPTRPEASDTPPASHIFIKVDKRLVKVDFAEIRYIEAMGDYLKIHIAGATMVSYMTIGKMEALLPANRFIRIHRSTIIHADFIQYVEGNYVAVAGAQLAIGLTYKEGMLKRLG